MTPQLTDEPTSRKPLRLWPGVLAAVILVLLKFIIPFVMADALVFGVIGGVVCAFAIIVWWAFFSRSPLTERFGAIILMIVVLAATSRFVDVSVATGMMGNMFLIYAVPTMTLALVAWAVISRRLSPGPRRVALVAAIVIGCGLWTLVRTNGVLGGGADLAWRWSETAEQRLLARAADEPTTLPAAPAAAEPARTSSRPAAVPLPPASEETLEKPRVAPTGDKPTALPPPPAAMEARAAWPGFRGPDRDDHVRGVRIDTDWTASPPIELWRRPIGPGWSSFAVGDNLLYTQEQRGDEEVVACYDMTTGKPVWMHRDATRFWESNGGAGPRATPTLSNGRVYTFGATGILNALDAGSGAVVWSRNASSDTHVKVPGWGFSSSPLVVDEVVIVATSGALAAYDRATGTPRWFRPSHGGSYSSPHPVTIDGVAQVLLMGGGGATSVQPSDGAVLWEHPWPGSPIVQPAQIAGGDILISTADAMGGNGMRRLAIKHGPGGWTVEERWTSSGLKPYFNDFVVHKGHAFGFDGSILACINLEDGKRAWKGGRYGNGQLVLLSDQDLLLVLSEEGELALVRATTDQFTELARFQAVEGKTWNHPVMVGDLLLVRNGEEMVAFRLSLEDR